MTGYGYAYDGPPRKCSGGPRVGTVALRDGVEAKFHVGDDGIFNCRPVRVHGSKVLSFHADGRAWDAHCNGEVADRLAAWLVANANVLGVQEVIRNRRRWTSEDRTWLPYHGDDPHLEHVHVAQCKAASLSLTLAEVQAIPTDHQEDDMSGEGPEILAYVKGMNDKIDAQNKTMERMQRELDEIKALVKT